MAIDIVARGLAASLIGQDGKISSEKMPTLGAVPEGTAFYPVGALSDASMVAGKSAEEILLLMLYGIVTPDLIAPSFSIELTSSETVIVGEKSVVTGRLKFDRGAIAPAYGTSGYRAGVATSYSVNGIDTTADFSIEIIPVAGENTIICQVNYAEGEQPLNSVGLPFSAPLPAGSLLETIAVQGIYQLYTPDGKEMEFTYFEDAEGEGYESTIATETSTTKQQFMISAAKKVVGIKQFEPYTQQWLWIGGSAEASLKYFDAETINDYVIYTHNGSLTGERELRIYVE